MTASGMASVAEARAKLLSGVTPPAPDTERGPLRDALGRILAEDVTSPIAVPGWANSAMDGYAVRLADLPQGGARVILPISQRVPAGTAPEPLAPGSAARIFTGAPLPEGADAVVMQENCTETPEGVRIERRPEPSAHIRLRGEDIEQGARVLEAGRRLRPQDLGLAASIGLAELPLRAPLRVAIVSTGDELTAPGEPLAPGHIYDSNGPLLAALLETLGCRVHATARVADTPAATREALAEAADAELVLSIGGVSVGEEDHVKRAVERLGTLELWRVAVKPGKPLAFGHVRGTPFLGLPGNPVSLFITFVLFAAPVIRHMQGRPQTLPPPITLPAGFHSERPGEREEYLRARIESGRLVTYPHQGSAVLSSVSWAEGLSVVPIGATVAPGDPVDFLPLDRLLV